MRRFTVAVGVVSVALALLLGVWFRSVVFADRSLPAQSMTVVIPRGATFRDISAQLVDSGVIESSVAFRLYAKLERSDTAVRAGEYRFAAHQSEAEILRQLLNGGAQVAKWVTIPEGFTTKQIAQRLQDEGFGDSVRFYGAFMRDTLVVGGAHTRNLEGYLFPSTYLIPLGASPAQVESIMTAQFFKELPPGAERLARARGLSLHDVVTLASLVQQEGKADDERPLIASVIYNRLHLQMPLQVDATLEYTFPEHKTEILESDLQTDSPYNTYKHEGLPPTPIANPGEPSLLAAFDPKPSPYLYYVYKGDGHHAFATTLAQHQANVQKYLK